MFDAQKGKSKQEMGFSKELGGSRNLQPNKVIFNEMMNLIITGNED